MKKKVPALAGVIIAIAILAFYWLLPSQDTEQVSAGISTDKAALSTEAGGSVIMPEADSSVIMPETDSSVIMPETGGSVIMPETDNSVITSEKGDTFSSPILIPDTEGIVPEGHIHARVKKIVDGDTVKVEYDGKEYRVRLLCIDTPESVKEGVAVQPYGKAASDKLSELLLDKQTTLVFEKDIYDRYDRLLAYLFLEDGTCVNAVMVEQGFARIELVKPNTVHSDYFNGLQENAIKGKRGLWSFPPEGRPFIENENGYYVPRYYEEAA